MHELLAEAHRGLGAGGAAAADLAQALAIYRGLGALPDVRRLGGGQLPGGLTGREADVLALVADGASNRAVAGATTISSIRSRTFCRTIHPTVRRIVSNESGVMRMTDRSGPSTAPACG